MHTKPKNRIDENKQYLKSDNIDINKLKEILTNDDRYYIGTDIKNIAKKFAWNLDINNDKLIIKIMCWSELKKAKGKFKDLSVYRRDSHGEIIKFDNFNTNQEQA